MEWDELINLWRIRHYKVVARVIGDSVVGTQGRPSRCSAGSSTTSSSPSSGGRGTS